MEAVGFVSGAHGLLGETGRGVGRLRLTKRESDELRVSVAAMLARERRARGLKLKYPEAVAPIARGLPEAAARPGASDGQGDANPAAGEEAEVEAEPDWRDRYLREAAELDNVRVGRQPTLSS